MLHRRWLRAALLLAVLSLLASACRGGDDDTVDATEDEGEPATEEVAEEPTDAEEEGPTEAEEEEPTEVEGPTEDAEESAGDVAFDVGVTEEPCPNAVNPDNGCIYLGTLSDLTVGPFAPLAVPITNAQAAFWQRVNEEGGIAGFDVDATEYVRDNQYNPEVHAQLYEEIKDSVLALAQTLGSPTTAAVIDDMVANNIVGAPASWTSEWLFQDVIVESGNTYCIESMNAVEWALANHAPDAQSVMAIHYPGDYGDDGAAGAREAAEANGLEFIDVPTAPGADNQGEAIGRVVSESPDIVVITTAPAEFATIVGQAAAQGFQGAVFGNAPAWNEGLMDSPAAPAIEALAHMALPQPPWDDDNPGYDAMRAALEGVEINAGHVAGWVWSYPLLAALNEAAANGDLTREGLVAAISEIESVDYEGTLPEGAGNFAGGPNEAAVRGTVIAQPSSEADSRLVNVTEGWFTGPTAESFTFESNCYEG